MHPTRILLALGLLFALAVPLSALPRKVNKEELRNGLPQPDRSPVLSPRPRPVRRGPLLRQAAPQQRSEAPAEPSRAAPRADDTGRAIACVVASVLLLVAAAWLSRRPANSTPC